MCYHEQGISVSSAMLDGEKFLVTFGGYNGKYYNEVQFILFYEYINLLYHNELCIDPGIYAMYIE